MDVRASIADYARRLVALDGVKALLLDDHTSRVLSVVTSQSWLLERDVLLIEKLHSPSEHTHDDLHAVVFVRPSPQNVLLLRKELRSPRFASYSLVFSNVLRRTLIEELADADEHERVSSVQELYADFFALAPHLVSYGVAPCLDAMRGAGAALHNPHFERTVDGIVSTLLALKLRPVVRYQRTSSLCRNLADRVSVRMDQEAALFGFGIRERAPLLLVLDRREDPLTPLLNQWTYEAMAHELVGLRDNRVDLRGAPNVNRYQNFGALGDNLKNLVEEFRKTSDSKRKMESIQDMIELVGDFPQLRRESRGVSRHVALAGELSRIVGGTRLLDVSQLEQDLACREAETEHITEIDALIRSPKVSASDKLRVVLLYALRYENSKTKGLGQMKAALQKNGIPPEGVALIDAIKLYGGSRQRASDIFSNRSFLAKATNSMRRGIGTVENVYTQHEPLLMTTLDSLLRGRLRTDDMPATGERQVDDISQSSSFLSVSGQGSTSAISYVVPPQEIVVVMAGGATYAESRGVASINGGKHVPLPPENSASASARSALRQLGARIVLCGSTVHNSTSFAVEIARSAAVVHQERENDRTF